jgi:hypothetical protein
VVAIRDVGTPCRDDCVWFSPTLLFNLGWNPHRVAGVTATLSPSEDGTFNALYGSDGGSSDGASSDGASSAAGEDGAVVRVAEEASICRIRAPDSSGHVDYSAELADYFSVPRHLALGDTFAVRQRCHLAAFFARPFSFQLSVFSRALSAVITTCAV